jgi:hypothetical protein
MTFEEFQKLRKWSDDLAKSFQDDVLAGSQGWLYCNGQLFIEDTSFWPAEAPGFGKGKWYTRIGNQEYQSDLLESCERPLYKFAASEGFWD